MSIFPSTQKPALQSLPTATPNHKAPPSSSLPWLSQNAEAIGLLSRGAWARREIFEAVVSGFLATDSLERPNAPAVWSVAETFIGMEASIDMGRGLCELTWRSPVLRMSIGLRLGDVRVGIIVPLYDQLNDDLLGLCEAYPNGGRGCERLVRKLGKSYVLFDYVFSGARLGDDDLTRCALSGDLEAMGLLADAIYHEAHHLRSSIVYHIHNSGMLLREAEKAGLEVTEVVNAVPMEIESELDLEELSDRAGVPHDAIFDLGKSRSGLRRFILLVPDFMVKDVFIALGMESEQVFKAA